MNTIIVYKKDFEKIKNYNAKHKFENFVFDEFKVIFKQEDKKIVYNIRIDGDINYVQYRMIGNGSFRDAKFSFRDEGETMRYVNGPKGELVDKYIDGLIKHGLSNDEIIKIVSDTFMAESAFIATLKQYIMNESYERKTIQKTSSAHHACGRGECKKTTSRPKRVIVEYLLDDIVEYVSHSGRRNDVRCECWGVRGHFRHYKSGVVAWIKPYEKGKKRNTGKINNGKIYTI